MSQSESIDTQQTQVLGISSASRFKWQMPELQTSKIPLAPDVQIQLLIAKLTLGISFYYSIITE